MDGRGVRQYHDRAQAAAGEYVEGGEFFFRMGMPHQEVAAEGIEAAFAGRQGAVTAKERAAAPPAAQGQVGDVGQRDRKCLAVIGDELIAGVVKAVRTGRAGLVVDIIRTAGVRLRAVNIPAQVFAGPSPDGIDGLFRLRVDGAVGTAQIGAEAIGRQRSAIPGDKAQVFAMVVERMRIEAGVDLPDQHALARMRLGQRLIRLMRIQAVEIGREQVREHAAVDHIYGGEAVRVRELVIMAAFHFDMDVRVDFAQQVQKLLVVIGAADAIGDPVGIGIIAGRPHDQRAEQPHLLMQAGVGAVQAVVKISARLARGKGIAHRQSFGSGGAGDQAVNTAAGLDVVPGDDDGYRIGHAEIGQVEGDRIALIDDQGRRRVLRQGIAAAFRMRGAGAAVHVAEAPHVQAGAFRQVHEEREGVQIEGRPGDAADVVAGGQGRRPRSRPCQAQHQDGRQAIEGFE